LFFIFLFISVEPWKNQKNRKMKIHFC